MLQSTKDEELTAGQKKLPPALQKAIEKKDKKEEVKLEDKNSGGIDALRAIKGKRLRLQGELERLNKDDPSYREKAANLRGQIEKQKEIMASKQREVYGSFDPSIEDALDLYEGGFKDIDIRKGDLKLAKDKKQALKDKYNAIMANQAQGDENSIADQIQKLDASIKKQEQELIDIMKKSKENQKNEAVDPERVQKLNQKIASMTTKVGELDKSKPENKTKEAILKSDIATAKLRLQDLMQKGASDVKKAVNEASKAKQSYKTLKMSLKKEQEINNKKKTLTDKPITKIEVNPKIEN
jgi:chromosome segregation ATPase